MVTKQDLLNGLVSYWDGSFSSLTAFDVHGENDGTASDSRVFDTDGQILKGFDFTKGNDYIDTNGGFSNNLKNTDTLSFSVWVKQDNNNVYMILGNLHSTDGYMFQINDGKPSIYLRDGNSKRIQIVTDNVVLTNNGWNQVVFTKSSDSVSDIKIYVDGNEITDVTIVRDEGFDSSNWAPSATYDYIGARGMSSPDVFFNGLIDEVAIWNRALSSDEVSTLYDIQKDGDEDGSYPFNALSSLKIKGIAKKDNLLIEGAKVSCINQNTGEFVGFTTSDENGEWEFNGLDDESKYHVVGSLEDGEKFNHLSFYDLVPKEEEE